MTNFASPEGHWIQYMLSSMACHASVHSACRSKSQQVASTLCPLSNCAYRKRVYSLTPRPMGSRDFRWRVCSKRHESRVAAVAALATFVLFGSFARETVAAGLAALFCRKDGQLQAISYPGPWGGLTTGTVSAPGGSVLPHPSSRRTGL